MSHLVPGFWIALSRHSGRVDLRQAVSRFGGGSRLLQASALELREAGFSPRLVQEVFESSSVESNNPWCVFGDGEYPGALMDLPFPPPVLWWQGSLERLSAPALSIVGARRCTQNGKDTAFALAQETVRAKAVVVSGAARGIDTAAHIGAEGRTIAVLGGPIGESRSSAAARLQDGLVREGGLLLSEVAPGTPVRPGFFPRRNRIIAALGLGCVVVEANRRSGALITARLANELGREVAAVPGLMQQPCASGCLGLIADGARCLRSVGEVVELLGCSLPTESEPKDPCQALERALGRSSNLEELVAASGLSVLETTRLLGVWEITGRVRREGGGRWRLSSSVDGAFS